MLKRLIAVLGLLTASTAFAGHPCTEFVPTPDTVRKALSLAQQTHDALDASGAEVGLVARVGQDLSKYHLRYSHFGIIWRDNPQGRWLVTHELNTCGSAASSIYNEGLGNFFLDDMFAYETLVVIPGADTQKRLAALLATKQPLAMHGLPYNMLAYPFSTKYQNSNQWALEVYAAASASDREVHNRKEAQAWLKAAGYRPDTLELDAMTRLGARITRANIAFDDHPFDRRMDGHIDTVTVDSAFRFIKGREPEHREIHLTLQ
jgi:hypothetical protein